METSSVEDEDVAYTRHYVMEDDIKALEAEAEAHAKVAEPKAKPKAAPAGQRD